MSRIILYPYKMGSTSSRRIAENLRSKGCKVLRVYPDRKYRPRVDDVVINWGSTKYPKWSKGVLNNPKCVDFAVDKIKTFNILKDAGVPTPEFTSDINVAKSWDMIVERKLTKSSCGEGVRICTPESLEKAPLYTRFIDKDGEYRVHIFNGECIDYTKKLDAGAYFVFVRQNIKPIKDNIEIAKRAVDALGLNFGAVDIIRKDKQSYVLEVNTACGVADTVCESYSNAIIKYAQNKHR